MMEEIERELLAAGRVVEVARILIKDPPYHQCRGPFCPLCILLPDRIADYDETVAESG